jgi:hypothetical protein
MYFLLVCVAGEYGMHGRKEYFIHNVNLGSKENYVLRDVDIYKRL